MKEEFTCSEVEVSMWIYIPVVENEVYKYFIGCKRPTSTVAIRFLSQFMEYRRTNAMKESLHHCHTPALELLKGMQVMRYNRGGQKNGTKYLLPLGKLCFILRAKL